MSEIDVNRCETEGNNQTPSVSKTKQTPCRKNHFITWFYKESDIDVIDAIIDRCKKLTSKGIVQSEICPTTGTPHIHFMLWGKKQFRDTELKLPKNSYNGQTLKDVENESNYANKEKSHDGKFRFKWGFPKELKLIEPNKWWQVEIIELFKSEPNDRVINWYWSKKGGVGKSSFAKYCVVKENCLFFEEGKKSDIMHLVFEAPDDRIERMIIDVPKANGNKISYKALESLKNGLIYSSKYEGGYKYFNSPHIIVFANEPPNINEMTEEGRWMIKNIDE